MKTGRYGRQFQLSILTICAIAALACGHSSGQAAPAPVLFRVQAASSISAPLNGRLIIFVKQGSGDKEVENSEFGPSDTWVAAREVHDLAPGAAIDVDAD